MKVVIASDLHLTAKPQDAYRMGVFKFLRTKIKKYNPHACLILGDLTDFKDKHPSELVNHIATELVATAKLCDVYLLKGNHDYLEASLPFFLFCKNLKSKYKIHYINEPLETTIGSDSVLFLPHTRSPEEDWKQIAVDKYEYIFLHQTLQGSRASNGQTMEGMSYSFFDACKGTVLSGDIHVPQKIGRVNYVGSPYHITFGDSFKPRCVLLDNHILTSLRFQTLQMHTINLVDPEDLKKHKINEGDHVKVRIELRDLDTMDWVNKRERVNEIGQELGLGALVTEFVDKRKTKQKNKTENNLSSSGKWPASNAGIYWEYCEKNEIEGKLAKIGKKLLDNFTDGR